MDSMQGKVTTGHRYVFSEGERVLVFIHQHLKLYHLSPQVQQVLPGSGVERLVWGLCIA